MQVRGGLYRTFLFLSSPTLAVTSGLACVLLFFAIPGFAQTNTQTDRRRQPFHSVVRIYAATHDAARDDVAVATNLTIAPRYQSTVDAMQRLSATFRRQMARVAAEPLLTVVLDGDLPPPGQRALAVTNVSRDADGRLRAMIRIGARDRAVELIAHELEHVIEQLDGIDLSAKARLRSAGVWSCDCGNLEAFETNRAVVTGLRAAREVGERRR